jgi:hypothetical protein
LQQHCIALHWHPKQTNKQNCIHKLQPSIHPSSQPVSQPASQQLVFPCMHLCGTHFVTGDLSFCFFLALAFVGLVACLLCFALKSPFLIVAAEEEEEEED